MRRKKSILPFGKDTETKTEAPEQTPEATEEQKAAWAEQAAKAEILAILKGDEAPPPEAPVLPPAEPKLPIVPVVGRAPAVPASPVLIEALGRSSVLGGLTAQICRGDGGRGIRVTVFFPDTEALLSIHVDGEP